MRDHDNTGEGRHPPGPADAADRPPPAASPYDDHSTHRRTAPVAFPPPSPAADRPCRARRPRGAARPGRRPRARGRRRARRDLHAPRVRGCTRKGVAALVTAAVLLVTAAGAHRPATARRAGAPAALHPDRLPPRLHPAAGRGGRPGEPGDRAARRAGDTRRRPRLLEHLLAERGYDVYAYDQLGSGRSTRLADPTGCTVARQIADLEAVRQPIGAERVVLLGASWGATLAAEYLAARPGPVARMVLTLPGARGGRGGHLGPAHPRAAAPDRRAGGESPAGRPVPADGGRPARRPRLGAGRRDRPGLRPAPRLRGPGGHLPPGPPPCPACPACPPPCPACPPPCPACPPPARPARPLPGLPAPCPACQPPARPARPLSGFYANQLTTADRLTVPDPRPALWHSHVPVPVVRGDWDTRTPASPTVPLAGHLVDLEQPTVYR
ncbi:alpha/beta fold hydrolase [Streptomyces sp. NPDC005820]|uniref:alpha/beta fold hydrolase n=1 Tax=Streptomyces sp. NPDC005820 TaxID=3157069 RepID=UPI0033F619ED